uniref:Thymus, brain and testes associated n=1 Tax=Takifugu rubripes TaxID=31033 RepID=A0A674P5Y7_TAKRU
MSKKQIYNIGYALNTWPHCSKPVPLERLKKYSLLATRYFYIFSPEVPSQTDLYRPASVLLLLFQMSFPDRSAASRVTTDERGGGKSNQLQFTPEPSNRQSSSSARFGALSHHSFFSRHNPHPHRVRHIQGNQPGSTSKYAFVPPSVAVINAIHNYPKMSACALYLRNYLCFTQYSAQTGRLIPPSSKSSQRVSQSAFFLLQVLELLCQILQTDSLTTVQQWLLLAGQRGNVPPGGPHVMAQRHVLPVLSAPALCGSSLTQPWRKPPQTRFGFERI